GGFDLVDKNVTYLQANKIDFLINQNPSHQGYFGILNLYKHLLLKAPIPKVQYLSLDIVVKENFQCYVDQPHQEPVM
ncbi:MAG: LacI family transcriptional regulator, partial [Bacteroidota bacterium]